MTPEYLTVEQAARHLHASVLWFRQEVLPHVPHLHLSSPITRRRVLRVRRTDLAAWQG